MKICPHCGNELQDYDVMCGKCGNEITQTTTTSTSAYQPYGNQSGNTSGYQPYGSQPESTSSYQPYGSQPESTSSYQPYGSQPESTSSYQAYGSQPESTSSYQPYGSQPESTSSYQPYGSEQSGSQTYQQNNFGTYDTPQMPSYTPQTSRNIPKGFIMILAIVAAITLFLSITMANSGPRAISTKAIDAVFELDFSDMAKIYAIDVNKILSDNNISTSQLDTLKSLWKSEWQKEYGMNYKINSKIKSTHTISKSTMETIINSKEDIVFGDMSDYISASDIKKMERVSMIVTAKGSKSNKYDYYDVYAVKTKGKSDWKILLVTEKE